MRASWKIAGFLAAAFISVTSLSLVAFADADSAPAPQAVTCTAAFELMTRAAPSWGRQQAVADARGAWARQLAYIAQNVTLDLAAQVESEMAKLAEASVRNPNAISAAALQCVADAPNM